MKLLLANVTTIICFVLAYLSWLNGMPFIGGLFLFIGLLFGHTYKTGGD